VYLKKFNKVIFYVTGIIAALCLFVIVMLVFAQVITRYFLGFAIKWASEVTVFAMMWMVFLGCSMGYKMDNVIALSIVTDRVSERARHIIKIIVALLLIFFFGISFCSNLEILAFAANKSSAILGVPMNYIYSAWSVAAVVMTLYGTEKILDAAKALMGKQAFRTLTSDDIVRGGGVK
jgi:TRAP-type C4-dicarboxylate transport system permease small subunit